MPTDGNAQSETPSKMQQDEGKLRLVMNDVASRNDGRKPEGGVLRAPEIQVPAGKITSNEAGIFPETRILSHIALSNCLKRFIENFKKVIKKNAEGISEAVTLLVYDPADIPSFELYASMIEQIESLISAYESWISKVDEELSRNLLSMLIQPDESPGFFEREARILGIEPITLGLNAITESVGKVADLVERFRTKTDFKNFDLAPDELLVVSILTKKIREDSQLTNWKVFNPSVFPINIFNNKSADASPLLIELGKISVIRQIAEDKKTADRIKEVQTELDTIKKRERIDDSDKERDQQIRDERNRQTLNKYMARLTQLESILKPLNNTHINLQSILTTSDQATKLSGQTLLLRAERHIKVLETDKTYTIKFTASARGTNRIKENIWTNVRITHSAGAGFDCLVFAADGSIFYSDSLYEYSPFKKSEDIPKTSR